MRSGAINTGLDFHHKYMSFVGVGGGERYGWGPAFSLRIAVVGHHVSGHQTGPPGYHLMMLGSRHLFVLGIEN